MAGEDTLKLQSRVVIQEFSHSPSTKKADPQLTSCLEHVLESKSEPCSGQSAATPEEAAAAAAEAPPPYPGSQSDHAIENRYRTLYEPNADLLPAVPDEPDLDVQHTKLVDACREFRDFLREKQSKAKDGDGMRRLLKPHSSSKSKGSPVETSLTTTASPAELIWLEDAAGPMDMQMMMGDVRTAIDLVYGAKVANEEKPRKARKYWQRFCRKLNAHSNMFAMVPNQNQYASVFCGAVKMLVQATANHYQVSEQLAKSLETITNHVSLITDHLTLWSHRRDIVLLISSLYAYIFHFLRSCLSWLLSSSLRRALNSFNETFADVFTDHVDKIGTVASLIRDKAQVKSQAEVHAVRLDTEAIRASSDEMHAGLQHLSAGHEEVKKSADKVCDGMRNLNVGTDALRKQLAQMHDMLKIEVEEHRKTKEAEEEKRYLGQMGKEEWNQFSDAIGQRLLGMLESNFEAWYRNGTVPKRKKSQQPPDPCKHTYTRNSLQLYSSHLADYTTDLTPYLSLPPSTHTDHNVIEALQTWSANPDPCRLWVCGPGENPEDRWAHSGSTSGIATTVVVRALRFKIPVLAFFSSSPVEEDDINRAADSHYWDAVAQSTLVNLVYSLIRQAIALLPRTVHSSGKKLSRAAFRALDGSLGSWDSALEVLKAVLKLTPRTCIVVLHGLDRLGPEWGEYVEDVMKVVGRYVESGKGRQWELLLTTDEDCGVLRDVVVEEDTVEVAPRWRRGGQLDMEEELGG